MTVPGLHRNSADSSDCPTEVILEQFIEMSLSFEENRNVREHVGSCIPCQQHLDRMAGPTLPAQALQTTLSDIHQSTVDRLVKGLCEELSNDDQRTKLHEKPIPLAASTDPNSLGSLLHYQIRKEIASGGTATVFEALDTINQERVAIKFIRRGDEETLRRVKREVRAISAIRHANVISIRSVERSPDGRAFLVMPLAEGRPLSELIYSQSVGSFERIVKILMQVASGLVEVHHSGLVHRDVKPSNIVVDDQGVARLTDFGLATFLDEESSLTESGMVVGTPAYMSPEQASGKGQVDSRSDVYSLGATFYECFAETKPFRGQAHEVLRQIKDCEPTRPSLINDRIPQPLEAICLKAMNKSPNHRYATVQLLMDDLKRWQQGKRVTARLPGVLHRTARWLRKDLKMTLAVSAALGSLMAGGAISSYYWNRSIQQSRLAASRFDASLQTINTLADLTSQSLNGDPGLASIRKQVQAMADKAFEPLVGQRPSDPDALDRYLKAMDNLGMIKHSVAGPAKALEFRKNLINDNRLVLTSMRSHDELRRHWARMHHRLAVGYIEMRSYDEAIRALDEAAAVLSEAETRDGMLLGAIAHSRGTIHHWANSDSTKAANEFRRAIQLMGPYCNAFPDDLLGAAQRNNTLSWLGECEQAIGNLELADKYFREVWAHYSLLADAPTGTYLQRLEKLRMSKAIFGLMVARGETASAVEWSLQSQPEVELLHASNPTLMEPAALKNSWGCELVGVEILQGELRAAKERADRLLQEATAMLKQFPNTTRIWQSHGFTKQNWMIACAHVADYESLVPFIEQWIADVDHELEKGLNVGFNQQFRLGLLFNLALIKDWSGDHEGAQSDWQRLLTSSPPNMKPSFQLLSQIEPYRQSRRMGVPFEFKLDVDIEKSVSSAIGFYSGGILYPSVHHSIAECHALALDVLKQSTSDEVSIKDQVTNHRNAAVKALQAAHSSGFYDFGDRRLHLREDPLFQESVFQSILSE